MKKILTFSVAAYNVEKYLKKLLDSILCVTNKELIEVLVVNDGSKDNTSIIAAEYENNYPEIVRVINKANGGHGSTINAGISEANGKYFKAIDGDDWVDSNALEKLLQMLPQCDSDLLLMDYKCCYEGSSDIIEKTGKIKSFKTLEFENVISEIDYMRYHAVIYKTQLLQDNKVHLDEKCFYVDSEFMLFTIPFIKTISYFPYPLYCYRIGLGEQSVSSIGRRKHIKDGERVEHSLLEFYNELPQNISIQRKKYIEKGIAAHCTFHINSLMLCDNNKEYKNKIIKLDKEVRSTSINIYKIMNKLSNTVAFLRLSHYTLYTIINYYKAKRDN